MFCDYCQQRKYPSFFLGFFFHQIILPDFAGLLFIIFIHIHIHKETYRSVSLHFFHYIFPTWTYAVNNQTNCLGGSDMMRRHCATDNITSEFPHILICKKISEDLFLFVCWNVKGCGAAQDSLTVKQQLIRVACSFYWLMPHSVLVVRPRWRVNGLIVHQSSTKASGGKIHSVMTHRSDSLFYDDSLSSLFCSQMPCYPRLWICLKSLISTIKISPPMINLCLRLI